MSPPCSAEAANGAYNADRLKLRSVVLILRLQASVLGAGNSTQNHRPKTQDL